MPKNFYNLPPSWNPGYAIPASVMDEGLERRAFVTNMTPRGTFDNPKVGNAGYAVPQYVDEEGYGRGTFTTKWLPRGYEGPRVPHWLDDQFSRIVGQASLGKGKGVVMAMQTPMGDSSAPYSSSGANLGVYGDFGKRAAAAMIANAKRLPPDKRAAALKAMMDKVDSTLYARAGQQAAKARAQGATPQAALAHGIAAAMTEGMLIELHKVGKSRTAPQRRSLLGLGCYGCAAALGADAIMGTKVGSTISVNTVADGTKATSSGQVAMIPCAGYSWTGSAWTLTRAGQNDIPGPPGVMCPVVREHTIELTPQTVLKVGPFPMFADGHKQTTPFTEEQKAFVRSEFAKISATGFFPSAGGQIGDVLKGLHPLAKFRFPTSNNPMSGKGVGLFVNTYAKAGEPTYWFARYTPPSSWWSKLWDVITEVAVAIYDVVKDAVELIGDLACGTVNSPGAASAAAVASGGAAAVGVAIAGGMCGGKGGTPPPPPAPAASNLVVPLAVIGGGALLIIALNKKKKAS